MILNLTQHAATSAQIDAGVVDLDSPELARLVEALTFESLPTVAQIDARAAEIAGLAVLQASFVGKASVAAGMIGGAPWFMAPLERALRKVGIMPIYAFSVRESTEQKLPDGSIRKVMIFRHAGFVEAAIAS